MFSPRQSLAPYLALLANAFFWGVSWWPFRKLNEAGLHSVWATAIVYAVAVLFVTLWRPRAWQLLWSYPAVFWIFLASGINNVAFNWALIEGEVVRVVLLFYLMPVWATLLARWLLSEAITGRSLLQIGVALVGAMLVLWRPEVGMPFPRSLPDFLGLIGGFFFAVVNVLLRKYADTPDEVRSLAMFGGATSVALALGLVLAPGSAAVSAGFSAIAPPTMLSPMWLGFLLLFALSLLFGNLGLQYGASRLPAQTTAVVMLSEVIFATASAVSFGTEKLTLLAVIGGALILFSALPKREAA